MATFTSFGECGVIARDLQTAVEERDARALERSLQALELQSNVPMHIAHFIDGLRRDAVILLSQLKESALHLFEPSEEVSPTEADHKQSQVA